MLTWQVFFFSQTATANRGGNASAASRHRSDWLRRASEAHNAAFIGRLVLRGEGPLMWQGVCHHPRTQLAGGVGAQFNGINLCFRLSFFFLSVDFADIENLGGWVINKQGTPCDVWTRFSRSVRMHISLRSTLPPLQCCNSGLFFFVPMKVQITL